MSSLRDCEPIKKRPKGRTIRQGHKKSVSWSEQPLNMSDSGDFQDKGVTSFTDQVQQTLNRVDADMAAISDSQSMKPPPLPCRDGSSANAQRSRELRLDTSRPQHQRHRVNHSTSSASSMGGSHQQLHHLNLPPYSPSLSSPQSPAYKSYRSQSPSFKGHHHHMSSISSTLSNSPVSSQKTFSFPPPSEELDFSYTFSPPSSAPMSDDGSMASPYIFETQTDLQDIFVTLAHKERRLLEAREQMVAAEKDLEQFKSQWNSVLNGLERPSQEPQDTSMQDEEVSTRDSDLVEMEPSEFRSNHCQYRHGKTPTSLSDPISSVASRETLPLRHSVGHTSELGLGLENVETTPLTPLHPLNSSLLGNFSFYFRDKLHGLFDPDTVPFKRNSVESTPSPCSSGTSMSMSFACMNSPASSVSSLSSSPSTTAMTSNFKASPTSLPPNGYGSSFIARFFSTYGPNYVAHPAAIKKPQPVKEFSSPTRRPRSSSFTFPRKSLSSPPPPPRRPGQDPLHQPFAPLLSYKFHE